MRDKIENIAAATLAAAIVSSPITIAVYAMEYVIKIVSVL